MVDIGSMRTTIGDLLDRQSERFADNDALVHVESEVRYTYARLRAESDRMARVLKLPMRMRALASD